MNPLPFTFLVCSERSGSNLITTLMGGHSEICAPPPSHLFRLFGTNSANYGDVNRDENWDILLQDVIEAMNNQLGTWETVPDIEYVREHAQRRTVAEPLRLLYERETKASDSTHVFVKENHTARFADFVQWHLGTVRFLYMVRDPRDVAASYLASEGIPGGVAKAVEVWLTDQNENLQLMRRLQGSETVHFLTYEGLLTDPATELKRAVEWVGLNYEPAMLESHKREQVRRNSKRVHAWENLAKPVMSNNSGKYASILSPQEIEYVELCCHEAMREFGYDSHIVSELPPKSERIIRPRRCLPA